MAAEFGRMDMRKTATPAAGRGTDGVDDISFGLRGGHDGGSLLTGPASGPQHNRARLSRKTSRSQWRPNTSRRAALLTHLRDDNLGQSRYEMPLPKTRRSTAELRVADHRNDPAIRARTIIVTD